MEQQDYCRREIELSDANVRVTSLKRDVSTRWTSTYEMLDSFMGKIKTINQWLGFLNKHQLLISHTEEQMLPFVLEFYKTFMLVTKVLEGNSSTINLSVIMFEDLKTNLREKKNDIEMTSFVFTKDFITLYDLALEHLQLRYQINDEMLTASLLDPVFQKLNYVKELLQERNRTKLEFLELMYNKYVGVVPEPETSASLTKTRSIRDKLALKHGLIGNSNDFKAEVETFDKIVVTEMDSLLNWWGKVGKNQFPLLSNLARIILQLSATSAEIERVNSKAGRVITDRRTSLSNSSCNKIMTVFYNFPILSKLNQNK